MCGKERKKEEKNGGSALSITISFYPTCFFYLLFLSHVENTTVLGQLACAARKSQIAISVNVCETVAGTNYNTQAVISSSGTLLAKYHKTHPVFAHLSTSSKEMSA